MTNSKKPFVAYWNNIPSPYMVERFNALVDYGNLDFEAWFNDRIASERSWEVNEATWRFRYRYMPVTNVFGHRLHWPLPAFGRRPDVLVSLYAAPVFLAGWCIAKVRDTKTCFRVLMTHDRWVKRHPMKETLKSFLFKRVDGVETPGRDGKRFAMRYGTPSERIFFATHTVDIKHYRLAWEATTNEREDLRRKLKAKGIVFIYVGRLWWGKGLTYLLDAFERVQNFSRDEVSLLLVGDGQDEEGLRRICRERNIRNVIFTGFKQKQELPIYYAISDVFVFPTLGDPYGLVVDEAMVCSLPVISTSAAGEIRDRIEDGVNGFIVPPQDSRTLTEKFTLPKNVSLREKMGKISAVKVADHTPEQWAQDFEFMIEKMLSQRKT